MIPKRVLSVIRLVQRKSVPVLSFGFGAALVSTVGCSSAPEGGVGSLERVEETKSAVIGGKPSSSSQDAVVLILNLDRQGRLFGECTGTLIAPRLVLTARHCVAETDEYAACAADGTPIAAGAVHRNFRAETFHIFAGRNRPDVKNDVADGRGAAIIDDGVDNLCNHDIALILLEAPIENEPIAPIRLDGEVEKGEKITAIGWGLTEDTELPSVRQQRTGVRISAVGPFRSVPAVPPNEFEVGESICSGDSGGPAIAESSGAVIGVVSRGGNPGRGGSSQDPAASCIGGTNLYTKISPFKETILRGYELAEAEPWYENGPDPAKSKAGVECAFPDECRSNLCLADPDRGGATTCAADCSLDACPEGQVCTAEGDVAVCRSPKSEPESKSGGCSAAPSTSSGSSFALAALGLGLLLSRRRRP